MATSGSTPRGRLPSRQARRVLRLTPSSSAAGFREPLHAASTARARAMNSGGYDLAGMRPPFSLYGGLLGRLGGSVLVKRSVLNPATECSLSQRASAHNLVPQHRKST